MGALAIPKRMSLTAANAHLCARLGVKLDGVDMGHSVKSYDIEKGFVVTTSDIVKHGVVEAYWR
jgi:hypothetical protein